MTTNRIQDREGWKRPAEGGDQPHPIWVDFDRHRVVCRDCPWFGVRIGATHQQLKALGQWHRKVMREVPE